MVWGFGTVCFGCLDFGFGLLSCSDLWVLFLWFWFGLVYCSCFGVCGCWIAILWVVLLIVLRVVLLRIYCLLWF